MQKSSVPDTEAGQAAESEAETLVSPTRPVFGSAKEAYDRSGLSWEDIERALAPMTEEEKEWGIA